MPRFLKFLILTHVLIASIGSAADRVHVVALDETLSQIARFYYSTPIYGPRGSLQLILRLNPEITNKHRIYPNQKILIRDGSESERTVAEEAPIATAAAVEAKAEPIVAAESEFVPKAEVAPKIVQVEPPQVQKLPEPSMAPPVIQKAEFIPYSKIAANIGFSYLALDGVDPGDGTSGNILSKLTPAVEIAWKQYWSEKLASKLFLRARRIEFEPEASASTKINNSTLTNSAFGIGLTRTLNSKWLGHFSLEMAQALFYRATAASTLEINQKPLLKATAGAEYSLLDLRPFKLAASGGLSYWSNSSYDSYSIKAGYGYYARFTIQQTLKFYDLICGLGYKQRNQDTSILNLTEKEVGVDCGLAWELK